MKRPTVLIIEDERALTEVLTYNLRREGFEPVVAHDGQEGLRRAEDLLPELILLDLMLPQFNGLEVCRALRAGKNTKRIPIIMMTAKAEETDQVVGFSMGADDYVTKPFSVKVLMQRIHAQLRKIEEPPDNVERIEHRGIVIDFRRHQAFLGEQPIELTPTEFRLLACMLRQPGRAFDRDQLMTYALGDSVVVLERTIDVHVKSLRRKLGDARDFVETVRGVGYRFAE